LLDEETIGYVEKELNRMISETDMRERIRWVSREISLHSPEDFALGYLIGSLASHAYSVAMRQSRTKKLEKKMKEREKKIGSKDYEPLRFRFIWTKKEDAQIRNILRRRLVEIRRKVNKDFHR